MLAHVPDPTEGAKVPDSYFLSHGKHATPQDGRCAMEWVAYLAGEQHTDQPVCVSPVLREFGMALNDRWDDEQRQKLRPYLARCIGTAGDGRDTERSWLAVDWLIRTFTPRFLDLRPELAEHAAKLRALSPVMASAALDDATVVLNATRAATRAAARDAARDAAWAAAQDAARAAAWAATRAAARAAARDAARAAARDAAQDAARDAAWAAAWAATRAAAEDVLRPVVVELQASALDLFDRMLPTEVIQLPVVEDAPLVCGVR
jgi:hypothetical protein